MAELTGVAEYSEKMERLETTTPGHADVWNIRHQLLLNNDAFLKQEKERLEQAQDEYYEQLVAYTDKVVADLIDGAPTTMDTLKELSDAINANKSIQEALDAAIGTKASQSELNVLSGDLTKHKTSTDHDGRYYTEAEIDDKVGTLNSNLTNHKASGDHDGRYYTETEINNLLKDKINTSASCNKNWNWSGQGGQPRWLWGGNDQNNFYIWNPSNFSVNYANSAGSANSVAWENISGKPGTYPPSNHGHGYLPTGGGTINGNLGITGGLSADYIYTQIPGATLHLNVAGWLNIETDQQLQVRNKADTAWKPVAAAAFNTQSARRYKKNIADMTEEQARKLLKLRPVTYDYKNETDGTGCMGFIAEEVDEIVNYPVAYNAAGEVEGIDYSKFVSPIVKMEQIHDNEISQLRAEIENLKLIIKKMIIS